MEYLKIAEIANRCEVKRQQIGEHYVKRLCAGGEIGDEMFNPQLNLN